MLTLTKKTEYALIAACHLVHADQGVVSARDISEHYGVRLPLLMNVLKLLNQGGILRSERGARGGYALAMDPEEITLADVIQAVEGPARLVRCAKPQPTDRHCELSGHCPLSGPLVKIDRLFTGFLDQVTIAELAFDEHYAGVRDDGRGRKTV